MEGTSAALSNLRRVSALGGVVLHHKTKASHQVVPWDILASNPFESSHLTTEDHHSQHLVPIARPFNPFFPVSVIEIVPNKKHFLTKAPLARERSLTTLDACARFYLIMF